MDLFCTPLALVKVTLARYGDLRHAGQGRDSGQLCRGAPVDPGGVGEVMRDPLRRRSGRGPRGGIAHDVVFRSEAASRGWRQTRSVPDQVAQGD